MHNQQNTRADLLTGIASAGLLTTPSWSSDLASSRSSDISWASLDLAASTPAQSVAQREKIDLRVEPTDPAAKVYDRLVDLKVSTSGLAMHLDSAWRAGLFKQLDHLLDADDWDFSDDLPALASFRTFLRLIIALGSVPRPSLGATATGELIAVWVTGTDRLTIECMANDQVRWIVTKGTGQDRISGAGRNTAGTLMGYLKPYQPEIWFGD